MAAKKARKPVRTLRPKGKKAPADPAGIKRQRKIAASLTPEQAKRDLDLKEADADRIAGGGGWINGGAWTNRTGGWINGGTGGGWINRKG